MNHLEFLAVLHHQGMWYPEPPSTGEWAKLLRTFPLFSGTSKRRLRKLVRHATFAEFAPGDTVVSNGGNADSLYVILGGSAKVLRKPTARGLRSGDYFGELALIDGATRSATVVATEELHVMRVPRQSFLRLARHEPDVTLVMLRTVSRQLRLLEAQFAQSA